VINTVQAKEATMKLSEIKMNEIETRSYREYFRGVRFYDNVDEYSLVSENSLSVDEMQKVLEDAGAYLWGAITYIKKRMTYTGGQVLYRHIVKAAMSPN
jgi:hypothetical protein